MKKGSKYTPEQRERMKEYYATHKRPGHPWTAEARAKISAAKMGHEVSQETRDKISASKKLNPCHTPCWAKGLTKETDERLAMSAAKKRGVKRPCPQKRGIRFSIATEFKKGLIPEGGFETRFKTGPDHPLWKGGISPVSALIRRGAEYKEWRNEVYRRDHFCCQDCGVHCEPRNIIAHHLKEFADYPELRFEVSNGITLCRTCHFNRHFHGEEKYAMAM